MRTPDRTIATTITARTTRAITTPNAKRGAFECWGRSYTPTVFSSFAFIRYRVRHGECRTRCWFASTGHPAITTAVRRRWIHSPLRHLASRGTALAGLLHPYVGLAHLVADSLLAL